MSKLTKLKLDTRELEHPKPLELAMKTLQELDDSSYIYMIHRKMPIPLLDLVDESGFSQICKEDKEGSWHILICKNKEVNLDSLIDI